MGGPYSGMAHFQFTKGAVLPSFPCLINRHDAECERPWSLTGKAALLEECIHFPTAWKCLDRAAEILIRLLALSRPMSQAWQYMVEIETVKGEQGLPFRQRKIQNEHDATGPKNAIHLQDRRLPIRHVAKTESDRQHIKRSIGKWQRQAIRLDQPFDSLEPCLLQHRQTKISSGDSRSRAGLFNSQSQVSTASG